MLVLNFFLQHRFSLCLSIANFDRLIDFHYYKNYYLLNREKKIRLAVEWGRKNKGKRRIARKKWDVANRGYKNFLNKIRIYKEKGAGGKITKKDVDNLFEQFGRICYYCKVSKANSIDHITPISKGGTNNISNLVPACISCNSKKGAKLLIEWSPMLFYTLHQAARTRNFNNL